MTNRTHENPSFVPRSLDGRVALVTGGGKRLGRAIALGLAADGADVIVHYKRSEDAASEVAREIESLGRRAWALSADLSDPSSTDRLIAEAIRAADGVDILINNASAFPEDRLKNATPAAIASSVQVHAVAPLQLARAMARQDRPGHVVNLLDSRVTDYDAAHASYHLGKRLLYTLTRALALELAPAVTVNGVGPGLILPPPGKDERYLREMAHTNPMNRHGGAEDIVEAVLYLLRSRFITGQVIFVDGGRHMKGRVYD